MDRVLSKAVFSVFVKARLVFPRICAVFLLSGFCLPSMRIASVESNQRSRCFCPGRPHAFMLREAKGLIQSRKNILGIKRRLTDSTDCWHWQIWDAQTRPFLRAHMQDGSAQGYFTQHRPAGGEKASTLHCVSLRSVLRTGCVRQSPISVIPLCVSIHIHPYDTPSSRIR